LPVVLPDPLAHLAEDRTVASLVPQAPAEYAGLRVVNLVKLIRAIISVYAKS
jgi:hypothetical protein